MSESLEQFVSRTSRPRQARPAWVAALLFLAVFFVLQMGYGASRGSAFEQFVIGDLTVVPAAALIKRLTPSIPVRALGNQLLAPGGGITVLKGCEGTEVMFMLAAAFAAVVMPWRRRLAGLGLGLLLVFCLNQLRLVTLFYVHRSDSSLFGLLHGTVAPIVLVIAVALYVFWWLDDGGAVRQVDAPATA
jgi:exosortase/archaeosortase family protein